MKTIDDNVTSVGDVFNNMALNLSNETDRDKIHNMWELLKDAEDRDTNKEIVNYTTNIPKEIKEIEARYRVGTLCGRRM